MAKRNAVQDDLGPGIIEEDIKQKTFVRAVSKPEWVKLRSLVPANVSVAGASGKVYDFPFSGSEVKVRKEDAEKLLAKRRGGCCGGRPEPWFELVE